MLSAYLNLWGKNKIGKGTSFGAFCDIGNVEIGAGCKIQTHVSIPSGWTIGNNVFIGPGVRFCNDPFPVVGKEWKTQGGVVENGVSINTGAIIFAGVTIGKNAMVGAGSVVTKNIPEKEIWIGNPARFLRVRDDL